jgi:hypothetical protein
MTVACPLHLALGGDPASHTADSPTAMQQKSSAHNFGKALLLPLPNTGRPASGEEALPRHGLHGATHASQADMAKTSLPVLS